MNKEDRKLIKSVLQHIDPEMTLPAYANAYVSRAYEYSLIHFVLNYYTMKEIFDEEGEALVDATLKDFLNEIHSLVNSSLFADDDSYDKEKTISTIDKMRSEITDKMTSLTAYTDILQIYEYILNRIEYGLTGEQIEVDESELSARVFRYLFVDNDKMVINSKIQMVTGQLPVRMTKSRFFDYIADTLNIYNGSECSSLDNFVSMLKSSAGLELPKGFETDYPDIYRVISVFEDTDYKNLDLETFKALMEQFSMTSDKLTKLVSNYLLVTEMINSLYAVLLAKPYQMSKNEETLTCEKMVKELCDSYVSDSQIPDTVNEGFVIIEGKQEILGEEIMQFESALNEIDVENDVPDKSVCVIFNDLSLIEKLTSNSLFVDLEDKGGDVKLADTDYVALKRDELTKLLTDFFKKHSIEVNRAVMAAMFSVMPVLFNSQQEIKDYIEYSLNHCGNSSELMACAKILDELMSEE